MARDPEDRYQTASDVIVDLERSQLGVAIPSFISLDSALQDPVVRQRLTSPIEATQPDMQVKQALEEKQAKEQQIWFLRYQDQRGNLCKSKATSVEILDRLRRRAIPATTEAARTVQGKYKPLAKWPEFQQAIAALPSVKKPARRKGHPVATVTEPTLRSAWWWIALSLLGTGILVVILATVYLLT